MNRLLLPLLACLLLSGCCYEGFHCSEEKSVLYLRLLDRETGRDLLFGDSARYPVAQLRAFTVLGSDIVPIALAPALPSKDSACRMNLAGHPFTVYLELGGGDTDTLTFRYYSEGRCCAPGTNEVVPSYNGVEQKSSMETDWITIEK